MRLALVLALTLGAGNAAAQVPLPRSASGSGAPIADMDAATVRAGALTRPMPAYPAESARAKAQGVAVAQILIGFTGKVELVEILQAPDTHTGNAVKAALAQWTFPPTTIQDPANTSRQLPTKIRSKLAFYFQLRAGKPVVLNPEDIAGPSPAAAGHNTLTPPGGPQPKAITEAEFETLQRSARPFLIDSRRRGDFASGHRAGAVNIPFDELAARGRAEIPAGRYVVLDCPNPAANWNACMSAARVIRELGFTQLAVIRK